MIGLMDNEKKWMKRERCGDVSGVRGVQVGFVAGGRAPVPAAVALFLLDAGVVP